MKYSSQMNMFPIFVNIYKYLPTIRDVRALRLTSKTSEYTYQIALKCIEAKEHNGSGGLGREGIFFRIVNYSDILLLLLYFKRKFIITKEMSLYLTEFANNEILRAFYLKGFLLYNELEHIVYRDDKEIYDMYIHRYPYSRTYEWDSYYKSGKKNEWKNYKLYLWLVKMGNFVEADKMEILFPADFQETWYWERIRYTIKSGNLERVKPLFLSPLVSCFEDSDSLVVFICLAMMLRHNDIVWWLVEKYPFMLKEAARIAIVYANLETAELLAIKAYPNPQGDTAIRLALNSWLVTIGRWDYTKLRKRHDTQIYDRFLRWEYQKTCVSDILQSAPIDNDEIKEINSMAYFSKENYIYDDIPKEYYGIVDDMMVLEQRKLLLNKSQIS